MESTARNQENYQDVTDSDDLYNFINVIRAAAAVEHFAPHLKSYSGDLSQAI